jgi:DNA gyrase subunit A
VVALKRVRGDGQDVMLITRNGIIIRLDVATIRKVSKYSGGVRLINLNEGDSVIDIAICDSVVESDEAIITAPPSEIPIQAPVETEPTEDVIAEDNDEDDDADDVNDEMDDELDIDEDN